VALGLLLQNFVDHATGVKNGYHDYLESLIENKSIGLSPEVPSLLGRCHEE
jgi:hypothetical protein